MGRVRREDTAAADGAWLTYVSVTDRQQAKACSAGMLDHEVNGADGKSDRDEQECNAPFLKA